MEVLGEPVGCRRVGEFLGVAELLQIVLEYTRHRVAANFRRDDIDHRQFERLVVSRKRSVAHQPEREQAPGALGVHDKWADDIRLGVGRDIGNVIAGPLGAIPPHQLAAWIPRISVDVGRGPIVEDAPVERPRPRPIRKYAGIVGIGIVAAGHVVAGFVEAAGIDPAAAGRLAVVAQDREIDELLAFGDHDLGRIVGIGDVFGRVAVEFLGQLLRRRFAGILVTPIEIDDRFGNRAAFLLIKRAQAQKYLRP